MWSIRPAFTDYYIMQHYYLSLKQKSIHLNQVSKWVVFYLICVQNFYNFITLNQLYGKPHYRI
jgi:hypothetical protein